MGCNTSAIAVDGIPVSGFSGPLKTRILQDEIVDFCRSENEGAKLGSFADGLPGVRDGNVTVRQLGSLPRGGLFEDENFPAAKSSLGSSGEFDDVVWLRPSQICESPRLFVDGTSRSDVKQGLLGDCWFLSACAAVATRQDLIEKVISPNQKLFGEGYQGVLVVSFWRFGEWVKVYVDDRLPTRDGCLMFASCTDSNEFWLSIVEKAFAKLHGSYEALGGGHALEAFVDLTGGIAEKIEIRPGQFHQLQTAFQHGAFVTCSRKSQVGCRHRDEGRRGGDSKGLIEGHAYTLTSVAVVRLLDGEVVHLVRIRNPWGNSVEWQGDWNDKCVKWNGVSRADKERLRVAALADGEFWMNFEDFKDEFMEITVATLGPDFDQDGLIDSPRQTEMVRGSWVRGKSAGGSRNDLERFSLNPQFLLHLRESDDAGRDDGKCSVLVGLMQEHRRSDSAGEPAMLPISFFIYKAEKLNERLGPEYFLCTEEEATSGDFTNAREVIVRAHLRQGHYVIIPATFHPDCETDFMIRIFALKPFTLTEIRE